MNAVVFKGPHEVKIETRPIPSIQDPRDVIVQTLYTALCGSDLHLYRGYEACPPGTIMGHEFCGTVIEIGSDIVNFKIGDRVLSPFTVTCGDCFYCKAGLSSRCTQCLVFGTDQLPGAQAQYVRIPLADSTVVKAPDGLRDTSLVLMADVFPTGYYAASSAFSTLGPAQHSESTAVVIGCGPVGLCAIVTAADFSPRHLFAVDSVPDRLKHAQVLGGKPLDLNLGLDEVEKIVKQATGDRGADIVIELVGLQPALSLAFSLLRPGGVLVAMGVHNEPYPWTPSEAYSKNLRIQTGRCPVRSIFPEALALFKKKEHLLRFMGDKIMPLSNAVEGYGIFDRKEAMKVIFDGQK